MDQHTVIHFLFLLMGLHSKTKQENMDQHLNKIGHDDLQFTETIHWQMIILKGSVKNNCCSYKAFDIFDILYFSYFYDILL